MKIHVSIPQTVELSSNQMIDVTIETLKQLYDIPESTFINEDGDLTQRHLAPSGCDERQRKATDEDGIGNDRKYP